MVLTYLFAGKEWRLRCREWTCGPSGGRRGWDEWKSNIDHGKGWDCRSGGRLKREEIYIHIFMLIHIVVW